MHIDGYVLAAFLGIQPTTIRKWAQRGHITVRGRDQRGRALYDPHEVTRHAKTARTRQPDDLVSQ